MESYGFPVALVLKNLPASTEDAGDVCISDVWSLNQEDPLEEEMATCSGILAWDIPWLEEPGGLQYVGSQRVEHNWVNTWKQWYIYILHLNKLFKNGTLYNAHSDVLKPHYTDSEIYF